MTKYAALLRGINSGKNPTIKMADLKQVFENLGFQNVATIIASGNVVFESDDQNINSLTSKIEDAFSKHFGFESSVILRTKKELSDLMFSQANVKIKEVADKRAFISFLKNKSNIEIPESEGCEIISNTGNEIIYTLSMQTKTPDFMKVLDKLFGKGVTTRSLKTVGRVLEEMG